MAVVAGGPAGNLIFALLVFWVVFLGGVPSLSTKIGGVLPDTPAARAGLMKGDVVLRIDGAAVDSWEQLAARIREGSPGKPLRFTVRRDGKEIAVSVAPEIREGLSVFGEKVSEPKVGISAGNEVFYRKTGVWSAFVQGWAETGKLVYLTGMTVVKLVTRVLPSETLGGPILIAQIAGDQARQGISPFVYFLGLLSVNLGVLNLLPIPILDGGHLLFFLVEGALGRPLSRQAREVAQRVGLALILALTALVFYNDIARLLAR
jgi:regulator of sigma E protease